MGTRSVAKSEEARLRQMEISLSICKDALKAIAANGDLHSAWNARKALNSVESTFRRANV
jgi:hypothetical protein